MSTTVDGATSRDEWRRPTNLHLRAVLERLPVAVLRIEVNGTLMAVNQAGLGLLGADSLAQVLSTSFLTYLDDSLVAPCRRLLEDAAQGVGGSLEIELRGLTGTPHSLEVHAVPHPGAPDATPSVMVTLRDVSRARQLALVLEDAVARQTDADTRLQSALQNLQQQQSRYDALLTDRQKAQQQVEADQSDLRQRLAAAAEQTTRAVARAGDLERKLEEAQRAHEDAQRAHESGTNELQARLESLERSHAAGLDSVRAALGSELSAHEAAHAAHCAELTAAHDSRLTELANAHGEHVAETEFALAAALAGQHAAQTALEQAETAFTTQRQRLEAEMAAARDAERAAQTAWTAEQSERLRAEVGRQHLVDAIARLAREAGVGGRADTGDVGGADPSDATGHGPSPDGLAPPQTSAW